MSSVFQSSAPPPNLRLLWLLEKESRIMSKKREVKFSLRLYSWLRGPSDFFRSFSFFFVKATADLFAFVILKGVAYVGRAQVPC